jgi:uncharacterized membrane protein
MLLAPIDADDGREATMQAPTRISHEHQVRMWRAVGRLLALALAMLWATVIGAPVRAEDPVVRAVLFYSPSCPHCHQVMTEDLPPIQAELGDALQVLSIDVTQPAGQSFYQAAVARFEIAEERIGVPTLIVGHVVLVGSAEIPARLPALAQALLADGGSDWPAVPGLAAVLPSPEPSTATAPAASGADPELSAGDAFERVGRDPLGNGLAIVVLVGLLASIAWVGAAAWRAGVRASPGSPSAWIAAAALAGLAVAAYLSSVELALSPAVCGPVGDCEIVHASAYARLFGVPVALLGVAGYLAVLGCWLGTRLWSGLPRLAARHGLVAMATAGVLFSVYLTFLEPFVIGATCAWCLASAILMAATLLLAAASLWPWRPAPPAPAGLADGRDRNVLPTAGE